MTRMFRPLLVLSLLLSLPALAKTASLTAVKGDVKVGKEGAWKSATPGVVIPETDFLLIPADATASVVLADGTKADFQGKVLVPGRRLASVKAAGALLKFSRSLQKAAESVVGTDIIGTVPGATRACSENEIRQGTCKEAGKSPIPTGDPNKIRGVSFMGEEERSKSEAERAEEEYFVKGDKYLARQRSEAILAEGSASSEFEKRRAALVLANINADEGEVTKAFKLLETVVKKPNAAETSGGFDGAAKAYRVSGLVLRGKINMELGDAAKAQQDFLAATKEFSIADKEKNYPLAAHRANLFLATLALESGRDTAVEDARKYVDAIPAPKPWTDETKPEPENFTQLREIKAAADELMKSAGSM